MSDLEGGDLATNCEIARAVLAGASGAQRDVVLMNASAALVAAGRAAGFRDGMAAAALSIGSGAARNKLDELIAFSRLPA
jgi:anthranilate phosphoribosyltransferase